jgi:hypothetical protein
VGLEQGNRHEKEYARYADAKELTNATGLRNPISIPEYHADWLWMVFTPAA